MSIPKEPRQPHDQYYVSRIDSVAGIEQYQLGDIQRVQIEGE